MAERGDYRAPATTSGPFATASRRKTSPAAPITRRLRLAFLAPDLVRRILAAAQLADLTLERLIRRIDLPLSWREQIKLLG